MEVHLNTHRDPLSILKHLVIDKALNLKVMSYRGTA